MKANIELCYLFFLLRAVLKVISRIFKNHHKILRFLVPLLYFLREKTEHFQHFV
jgi:hypothetical protein